MSDQSSPVPGWYADPNDASQLRWWDGSAWTEHVHAQSAGDAAPAAQAAAAAPAADPTPAAATPATPASADPASPAAQPAQPAQPAAAQSQPTATQPGAAPGGVVSNPAPAASGGSKGAVGEWFSIRSNQVLLAVLVVAVVLFILVMAGVVS